MRGRRWLVLAAAASTGIAVLHLVILTVGPRAYAYSGAPELGALAAQGSVLPAVLILLVAAALIVFALYGLSGAGLMRRLPLLKTVLVLVGTLYTLRGLAVIPDLVRLAAGAGYPLRQTVFSAASLAIGIVYILGTTRAWPELRPSKDRP
jgi:hypothetical protein